MSRLFEIRSMEDFLEKTDYLHVSFVENLGATLDPAIMGIFFLSGKTVLAELTERHIGEVGPLAMKLKGKGLCLFEREEIADEIYAQLDQHPELVGGIGTGTYWIEVKGLLESVEATSSTIATIKKEKGRGYFGLAFDKLAEPLILEKGAIHFEKRLSCLTQFLNTTYLNVPRERYITFNSLAKDTIKPSIHP